MAEPARLLTPKSPSSVSADTLAMPPLADTQPAQRLISVDALRGFSMFWIIGGDGLMWSISDMSQGKGPVVSAVGQFLGTQFIHPYWDGFRFYDLVFPLFIFVTGVAIVLALPKLIEREGRAAAHWRVIRRALILYALGILYYGGISQEWEDIRYLGVLQRLGICYLAASLMFMNMSVRAMAVVFVAILAGYWAAMNYIPVPGIGAGSFAPITNLANWIDIKYLPGRLFDGGRDPEGLISTIPAIDTCLLGVFAGLLLRDATRSAREKVAWLVIGGAVMVGAGYLWGLQFPVNKPMWTSSFVLVSGGYSLILLGVFYQLVEIWNFRAWTWIFVWIGANAILLYLVNDLTSYERIAVRIVGGDFGALLDRLVTPGTGRFVAHLLGLGIAIALARYLYNRRIFLRV